MRKWAKFRARLASDDITENLPEITEEVHGLQQSAETSLSRKNNNQTKHEMISMADKTYTARVKRVWQNQQGRRKVLLSADGVGDAWIGWNKTPKDMEFNPGDSVKVKLQKHDDGRWMTTEVIGQAKSKKGKKNNQQKSKKKEQKKTLLWPSD